MPATAGKTSAIFSWSGKANAKPVLIKAAGKLNPEAIAPLPGVSKARIFSDDGTVMYKVSRLESVEPLEDGMCPCKYLKDSRKKSFRSMILEF